MLKLMPASEASPLVTYGMAGIAIVMYVLLVLMVFHTARRQTPRAILVLAGLMGGELALSMSGLLQLWDFRPPPFMILFVSMTFFSVWMGVSRFGHAVATAMPFGLLIAVQAFRLPLELIMHQAALEKVMPPQLSYTGFNFDIITGMSAIILAVLLRFEIAPRTLIWIWNISGLALLATIVGLALVSMPIFQLFGPDKVNTWVTYAPFVWLPGFLVQFALFDHILVWRKLNITATKQKPMGGSIPSSQRA